MKTLLLGECSPESTLRQVDPDATGETEFEFIVAKALSCAYPHYLCVLFSGTFVLAGPEGARRPDLALVARDFSHWFVIEVELTSHSLEGHVLPQVRAFLYGDPQPDCASVLAARLGVSRERAETLVRLVPRSVAVVVNRHDEAWSQALRSLNAQLLVISVFESSGGVAAIEVEGDLYAISESLGFGIYSAVDRSCRFNATTRLPRGEIQLVDERGSATTWIVAEGQGTLWVTKALGASSTQDGAYVQLLKTRDGRLLLRCPH